MWQCFFHGDTILQEGASRKQPVFMLNVSTLLDHPWVVGIVALVGEEFRQ